MSNLQELKTEATELGIKFAANVSADKLQEKIDTYYEAQETSNKAVQAAVEKQEKEEAEVAKEEAAGGWGPAQRRKLAAEREAAARKTRIITIIDNDQRVNNQTTSAVVNCGNEMFDLGTVILPLQMEVEVMQGHIDVLKGLKIPQHMKGKDGLSDVVMRPRYTISYSEKTPE